MTPQESICLKLKKAIRQQKNLAIWHLGYDNLKIANEIAGRIVRTRELLHLSGGSTAGEGAGDD
jgi:hypothetical protein